MIIKRKVNGKEISPDELRQLEVENEIMRNVMRSVIRRVESAAENSAAASVRTDSQTPDDSAGKTT